MRTSIGPYAVVEAAYEGVLSVVYRCRQGSREIAVKADPAWQAAVRD